MEKRPFLNKEAEPTEEKLKQTLGDSFVYNEGLKEMQNFFLGIGISQKAVAGC